MKRIKTVTVTPWKKKGKQNPTIEGSNDKNSTRSTTSDRKLKPSIQTKLSKLKPKGRTSGKKKNIGARTGNKFNNMTVNNYPLQDTSIYVMRNSNDSLTEYEGTVNQTVVMYGADHTDHITRLTTHVIFLPLYRDKHQLSQETKDEIRYCKQHNIPIVTTEWIEQISRLAHDPHHHWSDIDVSLYVPDVVTNLLKATRRDTASDLASSIGDTYNYMQQEYPDLVEEEAYQRAIELSMLDWALVPWSESSSTNTEEARKAGSPTASKAMSPFEILGVSEDATPSEIRTAYRKRALETHPDKGGSSGEFDSVARAYRSLLHSKHEEFADKTMATPKKIKTTAHYDEELKEHRGLVNELFENHGSDLKVNVAKQDVALKSLGLYIKDVGTSNRNENDELIRNSCFYLSLAASYLWGIGALLVTDDEKDDESSGINEELIGHTALDLKRIIEAAVVKAHPEWAAQGMVGEEVEAFSDFLVYVLDSNTVLSDWAIAVFDSVSGFVDVYKGKNYGQKSDWDKTNMITLHYTSGHYQALFSSNECSRPTLDTLLKTLDNQDIFYVVTDGTAA